MLIRLFFLQIIIIQKINNNPVIRFYAVFTNESVLATVITSVVLNIMFFEVLQENVIIKTIAQTAFGSIRFKYLNFFKVVRANISVLIIQSIL